MKQKIVIKVTVDCDKSRRQAMKIAAVAQGVSSVAIEGGDKDEVVVIGDEVDSVCLANSLRKKFKYANILSVEEVKEEKKEEKKKDEEDKKEEEHPQLFPISYYPPPYLLYDQYHPNNDNCTIM